MAKTFLITDEQQDRIDRWLADEVYPQVIAKQRETYTDPNMFAHDSWDAGYPYEGASGGGLTYEFTPTSLGMVVRVRYAEFSLDLSDYENW